MQNAQLWSRSRDGKTNDRTQPIWLAWYTLSIPWHNGAGCRWWWKWAHIWRADEGGTVVLMDTLLAVTHVAVAGPRPGEQHSGTGGHSACQPGGDWCSVLQHFWGYSYSADSCGHSLRSSVVFLQQRDTLEPSTHWNELKGPTRARGTGPCKGCLQKNKDFLFNMIIKTHWAVFTNVYS